jgi:hypothetical protein
MSAPSVASLATGYSFFFVVASSVPTTAVILPLTNVASYIETGRVRGLFGGFVDSGLVVGSAVAAYISLYAATEVGKQVDDKMEGSLTKQINNSGVEIAATMTPILYAVAKNYVGSETSMLTNLMVPALPIGALYFINQRYSSKA